LHQSLQDFCSAVGFALQVVSQAVSQVVQADVTQGSSIQSFIQSMSCLVSQVSSSVTIPSPQTGSQIDGQVFSWQLQPHSTFPS